VHEGGGYYVEQTSPHSPVVLDQSGRLWALLRSFQKVFCEGDEPLSTGAVGAFGGRQWRVYGEDEGICESCVPGDRSLFADGRGGVWLKAAAAVLRFEKGRWHVALAFADCEGIIPEDVVHIDRRGALWVAGREAGTAMLFRFVGEQCKGWDEYTSQVPKGAFDHVVDVETDTEGRAFVASGPYLLVIEGDEARALLVPHRLPAAVSALAADPRGRVWLLLEDDTFACFDGRQWRLAKDAQQAGKDVALLAYLDTNAAGHLYAAGPTGGVRYCDGRGWLVVTDPGGVATEIHDLACGAAGCVWLATAAGPVVWDGARWKRCADEGGPKQPVRQVILDRRGRPWFGGVDTVFVLDRGRWKQLKPGLNGREVTAIAEDRRGRIWVGSEGAGVRMCDGRSWASHTNADGLPSDNVRSLACDRKGRMWVGTDQGLSVRTRAGWRVITGKDGLTSCDVQQVVIDSQGWVWVKTPLGLSVLDNDRLPK